MAKIPDTLFRDWANGDTITAQDYKKEHEIIKTANNDNDDRIRVLEGAALGQINKLPSGTVFPSNPSVGYVFYHTGDDLIYALGSEGQWQAFSPKELLDAHTGNKENPHATTASQVGAYSKEEANTKFVKALPITWENLKTHFDWTVNTGSVAQYRKDALGQVYLRGALKPGQLNASAVAFNLPVGFRPGEIFDVAVKCIAPDGSLGETTLNIDTIGDAHILNNYNIKFISLDGVSFLAEK